MMFLDAFGGGGPRFLHSSWNVMIVFCKVLILAENELWTLFRYLKEEEIPSSVVSPSLLNLLRCSLLVRIILVMIGKTAELPMMVLYYGTLFFQHRR